MLGQARARLGDPRGATAILEEALASAQKREDPAASLADCEFRLAQVLWSSPPARKRALSLATEAQARLAKAPASTVTRAASDEISAWLGTHAAR